MNVPYAKVFVKNVSLLLHSEERLAEFLVLVEVLFVSLTGLWAASDALRMRETEGTYTRQHHGPDAGGCGLERSLQIQAFRRPPVHGAGFVVRRHRNTSRRDSNVTYGMWHTGRGHQNKMIQRFP